MSITAVVCGGLGNQLFQYAAGRALALRNGTEVTLDLDWFDDPARPYWLPYELDQFTIKAQRAGATGERLDGYWTSESYFAYAKEQIRGELRFRDPPSGAHASLIRRMQAEESVAVHVRRGPAADYQGDARFVTAPDYPLLPLSYYESAMRTLPGKFYVFSDDPAWCRANLGSGCSIIEGNTGVDDLRLMSSCRHQIIANSTFSWWGAWLNPNSHKTVVGPKETDLPAGWLAL